MFDLSEETVALADAASRVVRDDYAQISRSPTLDYFDSELHHDRWRLFGELGWLGITASVDQGGYGMPWSSASILCERLAPAVVCEPLASQLCLGIYLLEHLEASTANRALLSSALSGEAVLGLAHHEAREGDRFEYQPTLKPDALGRLTGSKRAVIDGALATHYLVSVQRSNDAVGELIVVPREIPGLTVTSAPTFDGRCIADLEFSNVDISQAMHCQLKALPAVVDQAINLHAFLLASESLGIARTMLEMTHGYLSQREQFGATLSDFQVLQHRLVDMQLALTRLESSLVVARMKLDDHGIAAASPYISAAKLQAARAGHFIGKQAVQLHGAIGMTDELLIGRYLKRLTANELIAGGEREHLARVADSLARA